MILSQNFSGKSFENSENFVWKKGGSAKKPRGFEGGGQKTTFVYIGGAGLKNPGFLSTWFLNTPKRNSTDLTCLNEKQLWFSTF